MLAPVLADLLYDSLRYFKVELPKSAVVIPIPLHKTRLRSRGFNQSELIANILATKLGLSYKPEILIKIKKTLPQVGLLGEERRKNIAGTFGIHNQETIYGKNVILFDDVKTTGTTLEESARLIRSSGARKIWAITLAH